MSGRRLFWGVLVLALALVGWSVERGLARFRASVFLQYAETQGAQIAGQMSALGDQARPLLARNLQGLRRIEPLAPADARIPLAIGSHHLLLGNATAAIEAYRRALEIEPRAEIYLNLGRAELLRDDRAAALEDFRRAVSLDRTLRRSVPEDLRQQIAP